MEHRYSDLRHVETADALDARNIALAELRAVELYSKTHGGSSFEVRWTGGRAGNGAPIVSPAPTRIADARAKLAALRSKQHTPTRSGTESHLERIHNER